MAQKILIGVPSSGYLRNSIFMDFFDSIHKPQNTLISRTHGSSPAEGRNKLIRLALEHDCTHVLFIDDDVMVPSDIIPKLLRHDKDIVTGLYLMRQFPHQGIIFDIARDDGKCKFQSLPNNNADGLVPIVNCGLGAVLIKTEVFKKLSDPWITLGQLNAESWNDDIHFFNKAREAGFELYCDLSVKCGHAFAGVLWPEHDGEKWTVQYDSGGSAKVGFPAITLDNYVQK